MTSRVGQESSVLLDSSQESIARQMGRILNAHGVQSALQSVQNTSAPKHDSQKLVKTQPGCRGAKQNQRRQSATRDPPGCRVGTLLLMQSFLIVHMSFERGEGLRANLKGVNP